MDIKKSKRSRNKKSLVAKPAKRIKNKAEEYIRGENKMIEAAPKRITNETMSKHREEILTGAKKFKYPLKHSKYRIAIISIVLLVLTLVTFAAFSYSLLYKQQNIDDFAFRISKIVPFPVASVNGSWVRFEEYLFEVRQNAHYLINQENVDFNTPDGEIALKDLEKAALTRVEDNEIVRQLARQNHVSVSKDEIDAKIESVREAGGIGEGDQTLEDTLRDFYGWGINDLRRSIKAQLLKEKIVYSLDTETKTKARDVEKLLESKEITFEDAVKKYSEDQLTKDKEGVIGDVSESDHDLPPLIVTTIFNLKDGEISEVISTRFGLHIVKRLASEKNGKVKAAHILFKWQDPQTFIDKYRQDVEIKSFIDIN